MKELNLPQQVARRDAERLRAYGENLNFFTGGQWRGRPRRGERRLTFNYVRVLLEKVTSYMASSSSIVIEPVEPDEEGMRRARQAEAAVRRTYEDNRLEELDLATELDAAVLGDGCYKVIWDPDERRVRISAPDVQGIHAWWVADDPSKVWRVASSYRISAEDAASLYNVKSRRQREGCDRGGRLDRFSVPALGWGQSGG